MDEENIIIANPYCPSPDMPAILPEIPVIKSLVNDIQYSVEF